MLSVRKPLPQWQAVGLICINSVFTGYRLLLLLTFTWAHALRA
jgi:hypothetical protein